MNSDHDLRTQDPAMNTDRDMRTRNPATNPDPITGEPGSHPLGTGVGAIAGGVATGAAVGTMAGPLGTAIGAMVGAVVGGLAGHGVAEMVDPSAEDTFWRDNFAAKSYVASDATYDDYGPAYRYGVDAQARHAGRSFDEVESDLQRDWESAKGSSNLTWDHARHATRDSWQRVSDAVERATPGDSDHDGK